MVDEFTLYSTIVYRAWLNSRAIDTDNYNIYLFVGAYDTNYGVQFLIISSKWKLR